MSDRIEPVILRQLMGDLPYALRYLTFLQAEYFTDRSERNVFEAMAEYINRFQNTPTKEALIIEISETGGDFEYEAMIEVINDAGTGDLSSAPWIAVKTEEFIQRMHVHAATLNLIQAQSENKPIAEFVTQLQTSPMITVDVPGVYSGAPDFLQQLRDHNSVKEAVIPFDIAFLNDAVRGVRKKTLNIVLGGTNSGKSLFLCHLAASYMRRGLNVLYLSMEMDEWLVQNRVHANLLDTALEIDSSLVIDDDASLPDGCGFLMVQSFPTGTAHSGHFRSSLAKLKSQLKFAPAVIVVDYLAICSSQTIRISAATPQYIVMQAIAQELRALGQQTDTVIWTAAQANREGMGKKVNVNMTHTAGSIQINFDADLVLSLSEDDDLPEHYLCRVEKQRNGPRGHTGMLVVNKAKMRVYDPSVAEKLSYQSVCEKLTVLQEAKKRRAA